MTEKSEKTTLQLVENPHSPDVFAGGAVSFAVIGGSNVAITLSTPRWNTTRNDFDHVVIGRLVLPIPGAQSLAMGLFNFLKDHGLDPASSAPDGSVQ